MKAIIHKPTGSWVQFVGLEVGISELPQLFPTSSSLEGLVEYNKVFNHELDITDLEMIDVVIVTKSEYDRLRSNCSPSST